MTEFKPWLPDSAVSFMDLILIDKDDGDEPVHVLEHGAGGSTPWLAKRCDFLLSFEGDPKWYGKVGNFLRKERQLDHVMLVFASMIAEDGLKMPTNAPREYDLVTIDGRGRVNAWKKARKYLKPGGWLCWDDAERQKYWKREGLSMNWLDHTDSWIWDYENQAELPPEWPPSEKWQVFAFTKPDKIGSYTLFARKPSG